MKRLFLILSALSIFACTKVNEVAPSPSKDFSFTVTSVEGVLDGEGALKSDPYLVVEISSEEVANFNMKYRVNGGDIQTMSSLWPGVPRKILLYDFAEYGSRVVTGEIYREDYGASKQFEAVAYVRYDDLSSLLYRFYRTVKPGEASPVSYFDTPVGIYLWDTPRLEVESDPLNRHYFLEVVSSDPSVLSVKSLDGESRDGMTGAQLEALSEGEVTLSVRAVNGSQVISRDIPVVVSFDPSVIDRRVDVASAGFVSSFGEGEWTEGMEGVFDVIFEHVDPTSPHCMSLSIDGTLVWNLEDVIFDEPSYRISLGWAQIQSVSPLAAGEHSFVLSVERWDGRASDTVNGTFEVVYRPVDLVSLDTDSVYWKGDYFELTPTVRFINVTAGYGVFFDFYLDGSRFYCEAKEAGYSGSSEAYALRVHPYDQVDDQRQLKDVLTAGDHTLKVVVSYEGGGRTCEASVPLTVKRPRFWVESVNPDPLRFPYYESYYSFDVKVYLDGSQKAGSGKGYFVNFTIDRTTFWSEWVKSGRYVDMNIEFPVYMFVADPGNYLLPLDVSFVNTDTGYSFFGEPYIFNIIAEN